MAYIDKINVQGTDYDIFDERMVESGGTVILNENFQANGISGSEIVERMSGYSFTEGAENTGLTKEYIYAGAVKNGNKLTLVVALNLTRTGEVSAVNFGEFTLPTSVMNKIYPSTIGIYDYVSVGNVSVWSDDSTDKSIQIYSFKVGTTIKLQGNTTPINELTLNTKYYCRWELTILLSDNLIQ